MDFKEVMIWDIKHQLHTVQKRADDTYGKHVKQYPRAILTNHYPQWNFLMEFVSISSILSNVSHLLDSLISSAIFS